MHNTKVAIEPSWFEPQQLPTDLSAELRSWLVDEGSLTTRLRGGNGKFRVELQSQDWGEARASEKVVLALNPQAKTQIRIVKEYRDDQVIIYARTILPDITLAGIGKTFTTLGNRPIGEVLFSDQNLRRGPFQFAQITEDFDDYHQACAHLHTKPKSLWGRRSLFWCYEKPVLVTEWFLPAILSASTHG